MAEEFKIKIRELPLIKNVHELNNNDLMIVDGGETSAIQLSTLKDFLNGGQLSNILSALQAGSNIEFDIDEQKNVITINSTLQNIKWYTGDMPVIANQNDFYIDTTGQLYKYINKVWVDTGINLHGENGKDGLTPNISLEQTSDGYNIIVQQGDTLQSVVIKNGATPYINDETKTWFINDKDTQIAATGFSPSAKVEKTDAGISFSVTDESGTTTATFNTPTIKVDSVEMLPSSESPQVTNIGDETNVNLQFKIPKGRDGGGSITVLGPYYITPEMWNEPSRSAHLFVELDFNNRNVIDIPPEDMYYWSSLGVHLIGEDAESQLIAFQTSIIPSDTLTFYITSMGVTTE